MKFNESEAKYYPLLNISGDGKMNVPMTVSTDRNMVEKYHNHYLEEIIPHYFRLYTSYSSSYYDVDNFKIKCPICGNVLKAISRPVNKNKRSLYICSICKN